MSRRPLGRARRILVTSVVAALAATTGVVGLGAAQPAEAALCRDGGVSVVVDFRSLPGGVVQACDPAGGGQIAYGTFQRAGFQQRESAREPGFVCRVDNQPTSDPCINASPANAYWALWWSDGSADATWIYSQLGVRSLRVPEGGFVAWSFQNGGANVPPKIAPRRQPTSPPRTAPSRPRETAAPARPRQEAADRPRQRPGSEAVRSGGAATGGTTPRSGDTDAESPGPSGGPAGGAGDRAAERTRTGTQDPPGGPDPSASVGPSASSSPPASPSGAASSGTVEAADAPLSPATVAEQQGAVPWWVATGLAAVLAAAGVGTVRWRRRAG